MSQHHSYTKDTNNSDIYNEPHDIYVDDDIDDYIIFEDLEPYVEDDSFLYDDIDEDSDEFIDDSLLEDLDEWDTIFSTDNKEIKQSRNQHLKTLLLQQLLGLVKIFIIALFISVLILRFVIVNAQVPTGSMKNTILIGDRLIGFRLSYIFDSPKRGDVIIFKYPDNEKENFVKRVIGEPGDTVKIERGIVYINDIAIDEPYIREPMNVNAQTLEFHVPDNCYFVMGDNRNESWDSRYWTTTHYVEKSKIIAIVLSIQKELLYLMKYIMLL